ncbi:hypothetical protein [Streptacidiphilus fuscans]|uniref:Uncharacterized protein n=1 Tax=Streptacidiphilus fuscans TaxID=2789292 RepID=A0A931B7T7_9ACTN|nr:hypothetical protein [Streptacidiphilus fuscans]MBF9071803.1 hypothetical protein [Streptacidiphilus fuscans]
MRPDRFQPLLISAAQSIPGVTATTLADAGNTTYPYGVSIQSGGKASRWQIVATSAPGDRFDQPEPEPVLGDKPAAPGQATATEGTPAHLKAALAEAVLAADPGEIAAVDLYSRRAEPPKTGHGMTLVFHDASKIYLNHV